MLIDVLLGLYVPGFRSFSPFTDIKWREFQRYSRIAYDESLFDELK